SASDRPVIEFATVTGWDGPASRSISVALGQTTVITAAYVRSAQLAVTPSTGLTFSGVAGGPFSPAHIIFTLTNSGQATLGWIVTGVSNWVGLSAIKGILAGGARTNITISINGNANNLAVANYTNTLNFINQSNGLGNTSRLISLSVITNTP